MCNMHTWPSIIDLPGLYAADALLCPMLYEKDRTHLPD